MPTTREVLTAAGIVIPDELLAACHLSGLEPAAGAVVLLDESSGGHNVWGHDHVTIAGDTYTPGGPVTQRSVERYLAEVAAGHAGRQGCGVAQLTGADYQARGQQYGGMWDPTANARAGFVGLAALIKVYGVQVGFQRYNGGGSGSAASIAYGRKSAPRVDQLRMALAGATPDNVAHPAPTHRRTHPMSDFPATPRPADPNSDPSTWPQVSHDMGFDVAGGWEGQVACEFGVQEWGGRTVDNARGFVRFASWIMGTGALVPVDPALSTAGHGSPIADHWPTKAWTAPTGAVGITLNYAAPGGAYVTEGRSA